MFSNEKEFVILYICILLFSNTLRFLKNNGPIRINGLFYNLFSNLL